MIPTEGMNMEWISVKYRLPEINQWILASDGEFPGGLVQYCYNEHIGEYFWNFLSSGCGCCDTDMKNVTHWMPLPEPPKE